MHALSRTARRFIARRAARIFLGAVLTLAAAAAAHHGNPDAPAPSPWRNGPAVPGPPGPATPQGPGF
jgi:peptidoglycan/LPS O-acetylase OafA/YrhL